MSGSPTRKSTLNHDLHGFEGYWLPTRFGFDMRRVDFSSLILTDQMTRDEAMAKLEESPYDSDLIQQDFEYIATKLGITNDELKSYLEQPKKFYWDYRNLCRLLKSGRGVFQDQQCPSRWSFLIMATVTLVGFGLGNIQAFANIYHRLNIPVVIASNADQLLGLEKLILPGVGLSIGQCRG